MATTNRLEEEIVAEPQTGNEVMHRRGFFRVLRDHTGKIAVASALGIAGGSVWYAATKDPDIKEFDPELYEEVEVNDLFLDVNRPRDEVMKYGGRLLKLKVDIKAQLLIQSFIDRKDHSLRYNFILDSEKLPSGFKNQLKVPLPILVDNGERTEEEIKRYPVMDAIFDYCSDGHTSRYDKVNEVLRRKVNGVEGYRGLLEAGGLLRITSLRECMFVGHYIRLNMDPKIGNSMETFHLADNEGFNGEDYDLPKSK